MKLSGTAVGSSSVLTGHETDFGYNTRSELTDADRYDGAWSDTNYTTWTRGSSLSPGNYEL